MSVVLGILAAFAVVGVFVIAALRTCKPPHCEVCRDGRNVEHLPEFGVFGTALCVHCSSCNSFYALEATSREVTSIDGECARRDYRPRKEQI